MMQLMCWLEGIICSFHNFYAPTATIESLIMIEKIEKPSGWRGFEMIFDNLHRSSSTVLKEAVHKFIDEQGKLFAR